MNLTAKLLKISGGSLAALALTLSLKADPVQYIFTGTASGQLTPTTGPAQIFTNVAFTANFVGDTSNFEPNFFNAPPTDPAPGIGVFSSETITIAGLGTDSLDEAYVYVDTNIPYVGFGGFLPDNFDFLNITSLPGLAASDLTSSYGPETGTQWQLLNPIGIEETSGAILTFSSASGLTFQSIVTPSGNPVPTPDQSETLVLLALSLAAIGLLHFRTQSRLAEVR